MRTHTGGVLWSRTDTSFIQEPRLAPDGSGVTVNGDLVQVFLRSKTGGQSLSGVERVLGWFGASQLVVVTSGGTLGLVPVANLASIANTGFHVPGPCTSYCQVGNPEDLAGTIGI